MNQTSGEKKKTLRTASLSVCVRVLCVCVCTRAYLLPLLLRFPVRLRLLSRPLRILSLGGSLGFPIFFVFFPPLSFQQRLSFSQGALSLLETEEVETQSSRSVMLMGIEKWS